MHVCESSLTEALVKKKPIENTTKNKVFLKLVNNVHRKCIVRFLNSLNPVVIQLFMSKIKLKFKKSVSMEMYETYIVYFIIKC